MRIGKPQSMSRREKIWEPLWWWSKKRIMEQYLSAAEVAKVVGVHYRTIENWAAQGKLERANGRYGLISALKYRIEKLDGEIEDIKDNPTSALNLQKLAADVDTQKAIAKIKNLEADRLAGTLVDADEVLVCWQGLIAACRAKFLALPAKLALELSGLETPEEIRVRLTEAIDEGLIELVMK